MLQDVYRGRSYEVLSSEKAASTVTFSYLELMYISHQVKGDRLKGTGFDPRQEKAL